MYRQQKLYLICKDGENIKLHSTWLKILNHCSIYQNNSGKRKPTIKQHNAVKGPCWKENGTPLSWTYLTQRSPINNRIAPTAPILSPSLPLSHRHTHTLPQLHIQATRPIIQAMLRRWTSYKMMLARRCKELLYISRSYHLLLCNNSTAHFSAIWLFAAVSVPRSMFVHVELER